MSMNPVKVPRSAVDTSGVEMGNAASSEFAKVLQSMDGNASAPQSSAVRRALTALRKSAEKGANCVSGFLRSSGVPVKPSRWTAFSLNVVFHVLVLFIALTLLYIFVVGPEERHSLQKQFDNQVEDALVQGLTAADGDGSVTRAVRSATPALQVLQATYARDDEATKQHNWGVFAVAFGVIGVLAAIFVAVVCFLRFGAGIPMASVVAHIGFENLVLFAVIGVAEYMFFKLVASTYIPIMPSSMLKSVLSRLKTNL